nr:MAG TPA: hypothetical protein [Caudoviricetes sp.]
MKKDYIIQSIEMLLDKNHLDDSSAKSILLTMLQRYNDNDAETEVNPLLERLDKVRQQEEYARQLQKETDNKEFNLIYDKVKAILPRAKELHELRKEFNYPQTAMNPFYDEYPEFRPYKGERGEKADADDIIWVKNGIGVSTYNEYEHYVCVNYYDGTISVRNDFEKSNEPMSKYKQEWVNSQLNEIVEKFDDFYQCEYAKLEFELKRRSESSDAIIEKCKDREQKLGKR